MKCAIAAFAKTPGLSPVKTRLAAEIGSELSEAFYRMSVEAVEQVLVYLRAHSNDLIIPFWAVAEQNATANGMWSRLPVLWTGEGSLGSRIFSVTGQLFDLYDSVIISGTDSPQLLPGIFLDAYSKIKTYRDECVIGPSIDGGFYLFGSSFLIPEFIWTDVAYSRDDTLEQLLFRLKKSGIKYFLLEKMADADIYTDLQIISESLQRNGDNNLPAQTTLNSWLEDLLCSGRI